MGSNIRGKGNLTSSETFRQRFCHLTTNRSSLFKTQIFDFSGYGSFPLIRSCYSICRRKVCDLLLFILFKTSLLERKAGNSCFLNLEQKILYVGFALEWLFCVWFLGLLLIV
uniref:Uncharacterized protein n=1 Tax=Rhizophora mucronata TaxID=61149 RepID=A0A2P2MC35_RHIMU